MTAFNAEEHSMMRGIWGELETMNRSLTRLVELLENPPVVTQVLEVAPDAELPTAEERLTKTRALRREMGLCMLCGASRVDAGEGCYEWAPVVPSVLVWAPHSWPEETPTREQFDDEPEVKMGPEF